MSGADKKAARNKACWNESDVRSNEDFRVVGARVCGSKWCQVM